MDLLEGQIKGVALRAVANGALAQAGEKVVDEASVWDVKVRAAGFLPPSTRRPAPGHGRQRGGHPASVPRPGGAGFQHASALRSPWP